MRLNNRLIQLIFISFVLTLFSSCGNYNDISITSFNNVKFRGLNQNTILLSFDIEVDNPNRRKISVTDIEFNTWINDRELGTFRITETIKLTPCSKRGYVIPAEIQLKTIADAFKLATSGSMESMLDRLEVEGSIKAKSFPVRKTIKVNRQPFRNLASSL